MDITNHSYRRGDGAIVAIQKIVKKTLVSLGVGALAATGILIAETVQPQGKAEAAGCNIDVYWSSAYNKGCAPIRHLAYVKWQRDAIPGSRARVWERSMQFQCYTDQ